MSVGLFN